MRGVCLGLLAHETIKVEQNAMQRGNNIAELKNAIVARGSQLTDEMTKVLDEASKADFKAFAPDKADEEEQNTSAPKKTRARHS